MIAVFTTGEASTEQLTRIRRLLDLAFAGRLTDDDWRHALGGSHVTVEIDGELVAHGAVVERRLEVGERVLRVGYVEAVATHAAHRGRGYGSRVMEELGRIVRKEFEMGASRPARTRSTSGTAGSGGAGRPGSETARSGAGPRTRKAASWCCASDRARWSISRRRSPARRGPATAGSAHSQPRSLDGGPVDPPLQNR